MIQLLRSGLAAVAGAALCVATAGTPDLTDAVRISGLGVSDLTGSVVSTAGDFDGDGISDFAVSAPNADSRDGERVNVGRVYVLHGSPEGLQALPPLDRIDAGRGFVLEGRLPNQFLGDSLAAADLDGDGIDDLVVGAPRAADYDASFAPSNLGLVAVVFGVRERASAILDLGDLVLDAETNSGLGFVMEGAILNGRAGAALASPGDVNGDGIDDLLVGGERTSSGVSNSTRSTGYLVFGRRDRAAWPGVFKLTQLRPSFGNLELGAFIQPRLADDNITRAVVGLGDVNGDGLADFAVGAPQASDEAELQGAVYLIAGQREYPGGIDLKLAGRPWLLTQILGRPNEESGASLAAPGDLDADGRPDLAIGSIAAGDNDGRVDLLYAPERWPARIQLGEAPFGVSLRGSRAERLGSDLGPAGDFDADGVSDLLIGARDHPAGGRGYLLPGAALLANDTPIEGLAGALVIEGESAGDGLGRSVSGAGDLDADGSRDFVIGAPFNDAGAENAGAAFVYRGSGDDGAPPMEGALSHAWYDRTLPGQGVVIEYGRIGGREGLFAAWYTFEGGRPLWLITDLIAIDPSGRSLGTELFIATGGDFGSEFDPRRIAIQPWGQVRITQTRCDRLLWEYDRAGDGSSGRLILTPVLPDLLGLPLCTAKGDDPAADRQRAAVVGTWWDPERAGEGIVVDLEARGSSPTLFFSWFTFLEGRQRWLVGSGAFDPDTGATEPLALVSASGAGFGPAFDPAHVLLESWGDAVLVFSACNQARLDYSGAEGSGSITLERFSGGLNGLDC